MEVEDTLCMLSCQEHIWLDTTHSLPLAIFNDEVPWLLHCSCVYLPSPSKHHRLVITLAVEDDLPKIICLIDRKEDFDHKAVKENLILKLSVPE